MAGNKKIDFKQISDDFFKDLAYFEAADIPQRNKTTSFKRLATRLKNELYDNRRISSKNKIELTTYRGYVIEIRREVKERNYRHHTLISRIVKPNTLASVIKKHPDLESKLTPFYTMPALNFHAAKMELLSELLESKHPAYADVEAVKLDHEVLYNLTLDKEQKAEFAKNQKRSLYKKQTELLHYDFKTLIKIATNNLYADNQHKRAWALALLSGRRSIEIYHTASFKPFSAHQVLFEGQAKKQEGKAAAPYPIYTLIPASEFLAAFEAFRALPQVVSNNETLSSLSRYQRNREFKNKRSPYLNEAAKALMADENRMFKDTRSIYARACLDLFWQAERTDETLFLTGLLGHGDDSTAQVHYKQIILNYDNERPLPVVAKPAKPEKPKPRVKRTVAERAGEILNAMRPVVESYAIANKKRQEWGRYFDKLSAWAAANPALPINQTNLQRKIGGKRETIKEYMQMLANDIAAYNSVIAQN